MSGTLDPKEAKLVSIATLQLSKDIVMQDPFSSHCDEPCVENKGTRSHWIVETARKEMCFTHNSLMKNCRLRKSK